VMTFLCGCGYVAGFELLREVESPAHVLAALVPRFKVMPKVVYFDTACQAQRNALRRVPWLLHKTYTAWLIDRVNHNCSPVFNADHYTTVSRGHDTSGAERQHSINTKSKNSFSYMRQQWFIVRSRYMAAHNRIRLAQRRHFIKLAYDGNHGRRRKVAAEIQHRPVKPFFLEFIVNHCERLYCGCRDGMGEGGRVPGLVRKE